MARGWESKSVADQIEAADEGWRDEEERPSFVTPEARKRHERAEFLKLSRSRTLQQLEHASNPVLRKSLLSALAAVEDEIEELGELASRSDV